MNPQPWPSSAAARDHWIALHANQQGQPQADAAGVDLTPSAPFLTADSLATAISVDASATGVDSRASPATGVASQPRAGPVFYAMNSVTDVGSVAGTSMASWAVVSDAGLGTATSMYVGIGAGLGTATSSMYGGTVSEDGMQASSPHSFIGTQDLFDTDGRTSAATGGK